MHHTQACGQQVVDTLPNNRMSLSAAHLHEAPRPSHCRVDLDDQLLRQDRIALLLDILHVANFASAVGPSSWASAPGIAAIISNVRSASASSRRLIAKPTCTTT